MRRVDRTVVWAFLLLAGPAAVVSAASAVEDQQRTQAASAGQDSPAGQDDQGNPESGGWRFELFARGGAHIAKADFFLETSSFIDDQVNAVVDRVNAQVSATVARVAGAGAYLPPAKTPPIGSASAWNYLAAGGARLMRGHFGIEVGWVHLPNRLLTPGIADYQMLSAFAPGDTRGGVRGRTRGREHERDDSLLDSGAQLFTALVINEASLFGSGSRLFAGLGGGLLRVRGGSDWRLAGGDGLFGNFAPADPEFPNLVPPIQMDLRVTQRRNVVVYGGAVGFSVLTGNLVIRPRVDMYWSAGPVSDAEFAISDPLLPFLDMTLTERLKPRFILFTVDFALEFPRQRSSQG